MKHPQNYLLQHFGCRFQKDFKCIPNFVSKNWHFEAYDAVRTLWPWLRAYLSHNIFVVWFSLSHFDGTALTNFSVVIYLIYLRQLLVPRSAGQSRLYWVPREVGIPCPVAPALRQYTPWPFCLFKTSRWLWFHKYASHSGWYFVS